MIDYRINLREYNTKQIIEFIETGLVTRREVHESGRADTMFDTSLIDYLNDVTTMENTEITVFEV